MERLQLTLLSCRWCSGIFEGCWPVLRLLLAFPESHLLGALWNSGVSHTATASPKSSFRAPWRLCGWHDVKICSPTILCLLFGLIFFVETCMVWACHTPRQPLQNHPSGHLAGWATSWSAEEMLERQHQRVDFPTHARTVQKGLLQKRLEERSQLSHPWCPPDDPISQVTELNLKSILRIYTKNNNGVKAIASSLFWLQFCAERVWCVQSDPELQWMIGGLLKPYLKANSLSLWLGTADSGCTQNLYQKKWCCNPNQLVMLASMLGSVVWYIKISWGTVFLNLT